MKVSQYDFILAFADALDKDVTAINVNDCFREYEEWDSIALLSIVAMLDDNYNVSISREIFEKLETIQEMLDQVNIN